MSTIMTRSAAEFWWGKPLPDGVAYVVSNGYSGFGEKTKWEPVTYKEILAKKVEKQAAELQRKRFPEKEVKPCFIWVFYNDGWIMGGWYLYIKTLHDDYALNFRNPRADLLLQVMNLFPCNIIPLAENFNTWAVAFSKIHAHRGFKRSKKQGLLKCRCVLIDGTLSEIIT